MFAEKEEEKRKGGKNERGIKEGGNRRTEKGEENKGGVGRRRGKMRTWKRCEGGRMKGKERERRGAKKGGEN